MNGQIMKFKIELMDSERLFKEGELKLKRLFWELNEAVNPFYSNVKEIKAAEIEQCGDEILKTTKELVKLQDKIAELKEELGED